ncbi:MAG: SEC-C metal-binding domain-containing protein, partial [Clostridiaceae bacterium]
MDLGRNDKCWCGSGIKYKKCHMEFDERLRKLKSNGYEIPSRNLIKTPEQIQGIIKSAEINNAALDLVSINIKEGMSTEEIDKLVHDFTISKGAIPA